MSKDSGIPLKLVVIGDGSVGKTCALLSYSTGNFPTEYIPTIFENYSANVVVDNQQINLGLWDTAGQEEYSKIRPLSYPNTNIFLIFFGLDEKSSFENAAKKWYPELRQNVPGVPIVFVGSKVDLRDEGIKCITQEQGQKLADDMGCQYFECSAKTRVGLKELFDQSVRIALKQKGPSQRKQKDSKSNKDNSCNLI